MQGAGGRLDSDAARVATIAVARRRRATCYHTLGVKGKSIYRDVSSIKRSLARKTFSSAPKPRPSENSNPIAPHTRFHASARARPGFPCAPRNAPRRKGGPAEMAMARWPMAALLASVAPIGRHQSDVRGMPPAWNRSAAAELMVPS